MIPYRWVGLVALVGCSGPGTSERGPVREMGSAAPVNQGPVSAAAEALEVTVPKYPLGNAYFGDLHVHTAYSLDSYIFGNRLLPRDAYRFARGEALVLRGGVRQQLRAPLDFAAVTDHAELFGVYAVCDDKGHPAYSHPMCTGIRDGDMAVFREGFHNLSQRPPLPFRVCEDGVDCRSEAVGPWRELQRIAQEFNQPGTFTSLIGYEYTPSLADGGMLHRNVIFRGTAVTQEALSYYDLATKADLWRWLEEACTGECEVLAIPHNTNYTWGLGFAETNVDGQPYSQEDWRRRAQTEPLVELIQHKGSSECALSLGSSDEECAFEQMFPACDEGQETRCARHGSFVRDALKRGLELEVELGLNPFKLGFIGSTDTHNAIAGSTDEARFEGHSADNDNTPSRRRGSSIASPRYRFNPGGLAGVWAESNTREAIFDALRRRETFATSGPRIAVRFFGGTELEADLADRRDSIEQAHAVGVPMGGDIRSATTGSALRFLVWAVKDPAGARLQRVQVVKGWVANGEMQEAVIDVACSDGLQPDPTTRRCPDNGADVDLSDCSLSTTGGDSELSVVWTDPDFDPSQRAFYYARVLENPSCRWTTWESLSTGVDPPGDVAAIIQERAWSSPIWYTP